jgi:hypothetical protein
MKHHCTFTSTITDLNNTVFFSSIATSTACKAAIFSPETIAAISIVGITGIIGFTTRTALEAVL